MPRPRVSIAWLMAVILIVAVDCVAIRAMTRSIAGNVENLRLILSCLGLLPMANLLAFGLLATRSRPERTGARRAFLVGAQVVGWVGVALAAVAILGWPEWIAKHYLEWSMVAILPLFQVFLWIPLDGLGEPARNAVGVAIECGMAAVALSAPPLALALLGGCLNLMRRFRIRITFEPRTSAEPRQATDPEDAASVSAPGPIRPLPA